MFSVKPVSLKTLMKLKKRIKHLRRPNQSDCVTSQLGLPCPPADVFPCIKAYDPKKPSGWVKRREFQ